MFSYGGFSIGDFAPFNSHSVALTGEERSYADGHRSRGVGAFLFFAYQVVVPFDYAIARVLCPLGFVFCGSVFGYNRVWCRVSKFKVTPETYPIEFLSAFAFVLLQPIYYIRIFKEDIGQILTIFFR
jgi:hypothetical protein